MRYVLEALVSIFFLFLIIQADETAPASGTLIVTYQTDQKGYHLDRVRFWLINSKDERSLYPKKNEAVVNERSTERTVVIGQLLPGLYTIKFLVPNTDHFFEEVSSRQVEIMAGSVVKMDQEIKLRTKEVATLSDTPHSLGIILPGPYPFGPAPLLPLPVVAVRPVSFSLDINVPARWRLMHMGQTVYASQSPVFNIPIPEGRNYYIMAEELPDYTLTIVPKGYFNVDGGKPVKAEIFYQRDIGYIELEGSLPTNKPIRITIQNIAQEIAPISVQITPIDGKISWYSGPLPSGEYLIFYQLPASFATPLPQRFIIAKGRYTSIQPSFNQKGSIQVSTDTSEAVFNLTTEDDTLVGQGKGFSYTFSNLDPGYYTITFSSPDSQRFTAPPAQRIFLSYDQNAQVKGLYQKSGQLTISSNVNDFQVTLQGVNDGSLLHRSITNRSESIYLPEGRYYITYEPLTPHTPPLSRVEVNVKATFPQTVYLAYPQTSTASNKIEEPSNGIIIKTNISHAHLTIQNVENLEILKEVEITGKTLFIPLTMSGRFRLIFSDVPNYITPEPIVVDRISSNELNEINVTYLMDQTFVEVPGGEAIIGEPFSDEQEENRRPAQTVHIPAFAIGAYEVTNSQFAAWLNQAFQRQQAQWHPSFPGYVINQEGLPLCKTLEGNPLAQITGQTTGGVTTFNTIPGKEDYPVIEVTWYGAQAYSQHYGYRLLTENEWEKAAGNSIITNHHPLKRFKFGFSQDIISRRWANYRFSTRPLDSIQVLTTPVGFYNRSNKLPLTIDDRNQLTTHRAESPVGAYDMSGNVWEWVISEEGPQAAQQIIKGGCYDSPADGVRVSERLLLSPTHSDIYTGFRVARDIK